MQWTVRYFDQWGKKWIQINDGTEEQSRAGAGAIAYAKRKQRSWEEISSKADQVFRVINKAYKSPL